MGIADKLRQVADKIDKRTDLDTVRKQAVAAKEERLKALDYYRAHQYLAASVVRLQKCQEELLAAGVILSQIDKYDVTNLTAVSNDLKSLTNRIDREAKTVQTRAGKTFVKK